MSAGHRRAVHAVAAWLLCVASQAGPAAGQIALTKSSGEILAGQSSSNSSSTTIVSQGEVFLNEPTTTATTRVGFNVNADAAPGLAVAVEVGLASFDVRFTLDHAASFDLTFDFFLHGQVLRVQDEDCQGSISLGDVAFPTLVRLRDGAEFPLDVVLAGATLELDGTTTGINLSEQDSHTVQFRGEPVETTAYKVTFLVSATAISQTCEVSARFGADNGMTTDCSACVYPGFGDRIRDEDGLFVTLTVTSLCGNGSLDSGEQCDQGPLNGTAGSCCDAFCRFAPSNQVCRSAAGDCDQIETCTGQSGICPEDAMKSPGAPCTSDNNLCTDDVCDSGGECAHPLRDGASCDADGVCTCDTDGLFCTGPVRCAAGGGLCIQLPPPCNEDDTCDEERDICVSPFATPTSMPNGTVTAAPTATATNATPSVPSPTATSVTPGAATSTPTTTSMTPGTPTPTLTAISGICAGDCNGDGMVVVNELVLGVNVALGNQPASACAAFDGNRDGRIAINELVAGVNNALAGCRT